MEDTESRAQRAQRKSENVFSFSVLSVPSVLNLFFTHKCPSTRRPRERAWSP